MEVRQKIDANAGGVGEPGDLPGAILHLRIVAPAAGGAHFLDGAAQPRDARLDGFDVIAVERADQFFVAALQPVQRGKAHASPRTGRSSAIILPAILSAAPGWCSSAIPAPLAATLPPT